MFRSYVALQCEGPAGLHASKCAFRNSKLTFHIDLDKLLQNTSSILKCIFVKHELFQESLWWHFWHRWWVFRFWGWLHILHVQSNKMTQCDKCHNFLFDWRLPFFMCCRLKSMTKPRSVVLSFTKWCRNTLVFGRKFRLMLFLIFGCESSPISRNVR